jgi:hypothetical protein
MKVRRVDSIDRGRLLRADQELRQLSLKICEVILAHCESLEEIMHVAGPLVRYGTTGADRALAKRIMRRVGRISKVMIDIGAEP